MAIQELDNVARSDDDDTNPAFQATESRNSSHGGNFLPSACVKLPDVVNTDDQQLIGECLSGRTESFGQLVRRYQNRLYNTLVHVLGCSEEAQDVAQDTFVHAFRKLKSYRGEAAFYTWLFRIAMNAAISRKRKTKRTKSSVEAGRENLGLEPVDEHPSSSPSHGLEQNDRQELVREGLSQLSEEFRTVLVLKEIEGLKYEEIAEIVNCPIGTVRSRIHRARVELRQKLEVLLREERQV